MEENPFKSPQAPPPPEAMTLATASRITIAVFLVIGLNSLPYYRSRGAYGFDGYEVAGWPFHFYGFGGIGGETIWDLPALLFDAAVASAAVFVAKQWHKLRTWGTPWE